MCQLLYRIRLSPKGFPACYYGVRTVGVRVGRYRRHEIYMNSCVTCTGQTKISTCPDGHWHEEVEICMMNKVIRDILPERFAPKKPRVHVRTGLSISDAPSLSRRTIHTTNMHKVQFFVQNKIADLLGRTKSYIYWVISLVNYE